MKFETKRFLTRTIFYFLVAILTAINVIIWSDIFQCNKRDSNERYKTINQVERCNPGASIRQI